MKQEKYTQGLVIITSFIFLVVCFSGCTSIQNTNGNPFSGTWVGSVEMPMFAGISNTSVSQITFTDSNMEMTLTSERGTYTMNYTYTVNGDTLALQPKFPGRGGFPGRQPYNGSRPPTNGTWPGNGTRPHNDTWPSNGTRPNNGTWNPGGERPSMSVSFVYSFNEEHTVLYLNGSPLTKVQ